MTQGLVGCSSIHYHNTNMHSTTADSNQYPQTRITFYCLSESLKVLQCPSRTENKKNGGKLSSETEDLNRRSFEGGIGARSKRRPNDQWCENACNRRGWWLLRFAIPSKGRLTTSRSTSTGERPRTNGNKHGGCKEERASGPGSLGKTGVY